MEVGRVHGWWHRAQHLTLGARPSLTHALPARGAQLYGPSTQVATLVDAVIHRRCTTQPRHTSCPPPPTGTQTNATPTVLELHSSLRIWHTYYHVWAFSNSSNNAITHSTMQVTDGLQWVVLRGQLHARALQPVHRLSCPTGEVARRVAPHIFRCWQHLIAVATPYYSRPFILTGSGRWRSPARPASLRNGPPSMPHLTAATGSSGAWSHPARPPRSPAPPPNSSTSS